MHKLRVKPNYRRRVLRLPDLDHCKLAVLNSLGSPASRRVYEYAIDQFIAWYCSEPRLAFNRIVVVRYRMYLESRHLAANTINQQLAAVRRLAHEAADAGLLSPELAAGITRVKGVKQLGFRSGNWLSAEQSSEVLKYARGDTMRAKRDYAMLAMLFGCGFRRSELVGLELDDIQKRQGHWAVVDLLRRATFAPLCAPKIPLNSWRGRIGTPKTQTSQRCFAISETLARHLAEMPCDAELLFHTSNGTPWDTNLVVKRKLYPVLDRLGIARAGMHAFRHGNATVMDQFEVPTKVRQSRLGHADIATTMGYTHVVTTDDKKAAAELERIIFGSVQAETEQKTWQVAQGNA